MRNLKLLGVLLVSFMMLGLNVFAENIILEEERTEAIVIAENDEVTIDLNNQNLTVTTGDAIIIGEGATVTIKGNGVVNAKDAAIFNKGGNVIVENGTFISTNYYTVKNLGTMIINGGTYGQPEGTVIGNSSLISNGWYAAIDKGVNAPTSGAAKAIMTINGGTFNHYTTTSTIKSDDWSKTTINGGNFNSAKGTLVQATGEAIINAGEFVGYGSIALFNGTGDAGYEPATLTINGGTFTANNIIWPFTAGTMTITGGTFNNIKAVEIFKYETDSKESVYVISGGKFAVDVNDFVKDGLYATKVGDLYEVGKPVVESEIEVINPEKIEEVKEVTVGVKENEKTEEILASSILKDEKLAEKTKDISINVNVEIETIKEDTATEEVKTAMKAIKEKAGKSTVAHFFDISILVKNANTGDNIGNVTNLTEEIELMVLLPESLKNTNTKLNRNYFVLREHEGKVETIKAELSKDGKYLVFKTDKFSTYALAYEDTAVVEVEVPQTSDNILLSIVVGSLSLVSLFATTYYLKKEYNK